MPLFRRSFLTLLFILFCSALAPGQDSTMIARSSIGIGTGYAYAALKNEEFSPLTHSGAGLPVQVYFRQWTPRHQFHCQLLYSSLSLSSDFGTLITREQDVRFQYASHYRLGKGKKKITTWGGFLLDGQGVQRYFSSTLGIGSAGNNSSNEAFISLSPSILFERAIGNDKLTLQVWASIAAYVMRPEGGQNVGTYVSVGSFSKTEARLSYSKHLSRKWEARIDGQFQFYALSIGEPVYKINTQAIASIAYKF